MTSESWLRLLSVAEPGVRAWPEALRLAGSPEALLEGRFPTRSVAGLKQKISATLKLRQEDRLQRWQHWLAEPDHRLITLGSAGYPALLAATDSPPLALWCDGQLPDLLPAPQLAIVGSRRASLGGRNTARQLATDLSLAGITITSGLAFGIDAASHEGGLGGCGGTVAVLGSGIDQIYPRRNAALAKNIRRNGCLVSEYPPGQATRAFQFPARNRIIAGLSLGTLVVEAAKQSGSLITARLAGTYGREVFAIPGSIHSSLTKGCHRLLRDGAKLVEGIEDIIEELAQPLKSAVAAASGCPPAIVSAPAETPRDSDEARRKLLQLMDFAPVTVDEALADSGLTTAELSSMLLHLEMEGTVEALPGGRYCRLAKRS